MPYYYRRRTLCDVLNEMRACYKTQNFGALRGLIEEAQSMGNRMEAAFDTMENLDELHAECKKLKKKYDQLEKEVATLEERKNGKKS